VVALFDTEREKLVPFGRSWLVLALTEKTEVALETRKGCAKVVRKSVNGV
jgi:hypothetical protein